MKIVGISGKKQSGKNTTANILHGIVLKEKGLIKDYNIDANGKLMINTTSSDGAEGWGEFDITRKDAQFLEYAEHNMWPYVKLYSFADTLKWICNKLFDIPEECLWGSEEHKNKKVPYNWEKMPGHITAKTGYGPMTAREFMQYFGTDIMRDIHPNIWLNDTVTRMKKEQPELAIIADVRFTNEADAIKNAGGTVVRLTRRVNKDGHSSENDLDEYEFSETFDNADKTLDDLISDTKALYKGLQEI